MLSPLSFRFVRLASVELDNELFADPIPTWFDGQAGIGFQIRPLAGAHGTCGYLCVPLRMVLGGALGWRGLRHTLQSVPKSCKITSRPPAQSAADRGRDKGQFTQGTSQTRA